MFPGMAEIFECVHIKSEGWPYSLKVRTFCLTEPVWLLNFRPWRIRTITSNWQKMLHKWEFVVLLQSVFMVMIWRSDFAHPANIWLPVTGCLWTMTECSFICLMLQIQIAAGILSACVAKKCPQLLNIVSPTPVNSISLSGSNFSDEIITGLPQIIWTWKRKDIFLTYNTCVSWGNTPKSPTSETRRTTYWNQWEVVDNTGLISIYNSKEGPSLL